MSVVSYMEEIWIKYENLSGNEYDYPCERVDKVTDQAWILICILVTELWIITLALTYILFHYLSCGHNFRKRNRSVKRA